MARIEALELTDDHSGVWMFVAAKPGARRNEILGMHSGALRVAVTAAPDKGKANQALIDLLAQALGVPKSSVEIVRGLTARRKKVLVRGISSIELRTRLSRVLAKGNP